MLITYSSNYSREMYIPLTVIKRFKIPHGLSALLVCRWGELVPTRESRDPTVIRRMKKKKKKKKRKKKTEKKKT